MKCSEKERESCNVEKRGCKGCYYSIGIDYGKEESKSAISRKIEMTETEKRIKELQQYEYNKDKIEIGEYVRTKKGISKLLGLGLVYGTFEVDKNGIYRSNNSFSDFIERKDIIKHSKNIIDLIEIGDYVNSVQVKSIINTDIKHLILKDVLCCVYNKDIKTIVTKEQFASIEYKI